MTSSTELAYFVASILGAIATIFLCIGTLVYYADDMRHKKHVRAMAHRESSPTLLTNLALLSYPSPGSALALSPTSPPPQADLRELSRNLIASVNSLRIELNNIATILDGSPQIRRQTANVQANMANDALVDDSLALVNELSDYFAGLNIG